jgi:hypothetical protein
LSKYFRFSTAWSRRKLAEPKEYFPEAKSPSDGEQCWEAPNPANEVSFQTDTVAFRGSAHDARITIRAGRLVLIGTACPAIDATM